MATMEEALAKIRPHKNSGLAHQKAPATLLSALESTLDDQKTERSPVAYFATLLTALEATIQKNELSIGEGDVLPAELYLLALVAPFVPVPVLRTHISIVLSLTSPLFPVLEPHAPALRSQINLYHTLFSSLDRSQLDVQGIRQTFASVLQLCVDKRPKVRKRAAEVIESILSDPPAPLSRHPYAEKVASWAQSLLDHVNGNVFGKSKAVDPADTAIHLLAFLRPVLLLLPPSSLPQITTSILNLPRFGNSYLSQSAYTTLSSVFIAAADDSTNPISHQILDVLNAVLASPPLQTDNVLAPAWIQVVGNATFAYSQVDEDASEQQLLKVWKIIWSYLESTHTQTREAAVKSLQTITQGFSDAHLSSSGFAVAKIIAHSSKALDSLAYARSVPEMFAVFSTLFAVVGPHSSTALRPVIEKIGTMRTGKNFEYKEDADRTLTAAMQALGPEELLQLLPLNLEPVDREAGKEPRAYILPMLAHPHPSSIKHFVSYFVPMSERMFDLQQKAETEGRAAEAKVWGVLVAQVWAGLPCYNWASADLPQTFDQGFSALLSQLLYGQQELRPPVLRALKVAVESNVALTKDDERAPRAISKEQAVANVNFLKTQSESWLAVLFNVFSSVDRDSRSSVGNVINAWASISEEKELSQAFQKVLGLFKQNLATNRPAMGASGNKEGSVTAMMQDILLILLPYLSVADAQELCTVLLTNEVLGSSDNGVQKRGYKLLATVIETDKVQVDAEEVLKQLDGFSSALAPAAKKDRFSLLSQLVPKLPSTAMHVIPSLIPEAVLGTKEPSEKGRLAAFEFIVQMGNKMGEGGVVKRSMIDGMDEDDEMTDATASVEEYVTMVAGGLAGATPHMISATITAISRLLFEFKDQISETMHTELLTTLTVFVTSNNREIVKSALGFIKLSIHTLPLELLRPHLPQLIPALMNWSHDHANHFKVKVRHIFERLMRRVSFEEIYSCVGDTDEARERGKVLVNIKKRKERAKRKRAARDDAAEEGGDEDEQPTAKKSGGDAFEDVLYGSESELEDSDDEDRPAAAAKGKDAQKGKGNKKNDRGARLRLDDDQPMDLLEGAASRISTNQRGNKRKPGQDASKFKTEDDTGKLILNDSSDDEADGSKAANDVAGTAYREGITSVDGFTRGPNGRVKFHKDTKKRRREEADAGADGDVEMGDADPGSKGRESKAKKQQTAFGKEFKAKRAGGDVKKQGMDPYAYMPLGQAAKKGKGGKSKLGIAGKH